MAGATKFHDPTFRSGETGTSDRWSAIMGNEPILGILIGLIISVPIWAILILIAWSIL